MKKQLSIQNKENYFVIFRFFLHKINIPEDLFSLMLNFPRNQVCVPR